MSLTEDEEITDTVTDNLGKELTIVSATTEQGLLIQSKKDERKSKEDSTPDEYIVGTKGLILLNDRK